MTAPSATSSLTLDPGLADRLLELARSARPAEACAILSGPHGARATWIHEARNALASPYRYDVHPEDLVRIVTAVDAAGDDVVAIFHSHPSGPAIPSATDRREARHDAIHLVAGIGPGGDFELRAWRIHGGDATEVVLRA